MPLSTIPARSPNIDIQAIFTLASVILVLAKDTPLFANAKLVLVLAVHS